MNGINFLVSTSTDYVTQINNLKTFLMLIVPGVAVLSLIVCGIGMGVPNQQISQFCSNHIWKIGTGLFIIAGASAFVSLFLP